MKRILIILFIFFYNFSNAQSGLLNGSGSAPDFTVVDLNGNSHNLYSYLDSGFVTVLELLSVTCGHCQMHASGTNNSYSLNGPNGNNSARFLGLEVNGFNDSATVANYVNSFNVLFPMVNDVSPAVINYQINYTPTYYVVFPDRTYTTICTNCVTPTSSLTIESLLNNAINSWPPVYGCIDSAAVNYDSNANSDDGSCNYTSYTIKTLGMTFSPDTTYCNLGDTINFVLGQAHNAVEVDQSTYLSGGNLSNGGFSFGYGATGMFIPNNIQDYYYVCQPHASAGMLGMINVSPPQIYGCIDSLAFNYDSLANTNDNSCKYPSITITNPLNMSNIFTSYVNIDFTVNDFLVGFPSSFVDGHIHYYVNGIMTPHYDITSILLPNLSNGSYEIVLRLFDNNHQPLIEDVADTITFFVNITNGCTDPLASNYDPDATINDGSCIFDVYGCTSQSAVNYNSNATIDDGSCCELSTQNTCWGCTDSLADNYNPNVVLDDGSCTYCTGIVTGLSVSDIIHDRATFNFDNMNTYDATGAQVCRVDQIRIKYRPVGTSSWIQKNMAQPTGYDAVTGICNSTQNTAKITRNLMSSTTYEWEVKVWYCDGQSTGFV
ncbi:MAG: plastocyanin/azurin family copper-binding protein, partial [Flavobacteriales bacterium]|nr:plastocyanin/azurin family copper-binding protein [Flavobacteriales bacterium]